MNRIKDFLEVSKDAFLNTFKSFKNSYVLILAVAIMSVFAILRSAVIGGGLIVSIITYIIDIMILSVIAGILNSIINYNNTGKNSIQSGYKMYFNSIINAMFVVYIIEFLLTWTIQLANFPSSVNIVIMFLYRILVTPVIELVYIAGFQGYGIIRECFRFIKQNSLIWIPYALLFVFLDQIFVNRAMMMLGFHGVGVGFLLAMLVSVLIRSFFYIFKGHLFKNLYENSYRKRMFKRSF